MLRLTVRLSVDHVVKVGGSGTLPRSFKAVLPAGHVYLIGVLSEPGKGVDVLPVLSKWTHLDGVNVGIRAMFARMNAAFKANPLYPVTDRIFPFAEVADALRYLQSGQHFSKVVLSLQATAPCVS